MIRYENCTPKSDSQSHLRPRLLCEFAGGISLNLHMAVIGPSGNTASISADEGNMLREGSDGKLYARMEWTGIPNW